MWEQWKALRSRLGTPQHAHSLLLAVLCCHILNQIGVLVKLVRFSSNRDPENHIEENASGTQTQIILRFLMAVLSEACVYFEERKDLLAKLNEAHMLSSLQMNLGKRARRSERQICM
jgi:hypothetical protein